MPDPWDDAWLEAVASNDRENMPFETLELIHPEFTENGVPTAVRCVNDLVPHTFTLELEAPRNPGEAVTFERIPFEFEHPDVGDGIAPSCKITVSNIRSQVGKYLDAAELSGQPITVIYRVFMQKSPTVVSLGPWAFVMREIDEAGANVSGAATLARPQNEKFPTRFLTADFAPALLKQSVAT